MRERLILDVIRILSIPYEEIEFIRVEKEGREIASIIENGRFSLVGTEELNRVLDETC